MAVLEKEERVGVVNGKEELVPVPTISSATSAVLKGLFMVLEYLFKDNCRSDISRYQKSFQCLPECNFGWLCIYAVCPKVCWRLPGGSTEELRVDQSGPTRCSWCPGLLHPAPETTPEYSSQVGSAHSQLLVPQSCCGESLGVALPCRPCRPPQSLIFKQLPQTWNLTSA